jgi:hypothetical protein
MGVHQRVAEVLATYGQDMHPHAKVIEIDVPKAGTPAGVVVLDRITAEKPDYCVHGYAECIRCRRMCFLGSETSKIATEGKAYPICMECAQEVIPPDTQPRGNANDHKRANGPHE